MAFPNRLELYFTSDRPGGNGNGDLWVTRRATVDSEWGTPVNLGTLVNSAYEDGCQSLSSNGLELYFISSRPGGYGSWDLWMATRVTVSANWGTPVNLGPTINTSAMENFPCVSPDGLLLFFASTRPGGYGNLDLYVARRATRGDPWGTPMNLGPVVNSGYHENGPRIMADGSMLYFISNRPGGVGGFDFWQAPITPHCGLQRRRQSRCGRLGSPGGQLGQEQLGRAISARLPGAMASWMRRTWRSSWNR